MSGLLVAGNADVRRRTVVLCLPYAAWDFLETEADVRNANLSAHVSDMLLCALRVRGFTPSRELLPNNQKLEAVVL